MLAVFAVAVAVGLDNFAAAIAIGLAGVDARVRLRVGVVFGVFEAGMPIVGLLIGAQAATSLGHASRWLAAGLLIAVGGYALAEAVRDARHAPPQSQLAPAAGSALGAGSAPAAGSAPERAVPERAVPEREGPERAVPERAVPERAVPERLGARGRLVLTGLAMSVDNLAVGFALGSYHTSVLVGAVTIGAVSVSLALLGLEVGARLGARAGERGGQLAGLILIAVGIAIAAGVLS